MAGYGSYYNESSPGDVFQGADLQWGAGGPSDSFYGQNVDKRFQGSGAVGLPRVYHGWDAGARAAFQPSIAYSQSAQKLGDFWSGKMDQDYEKQFMDISRQSIDKNLETSRRDYRDMAAAGGFGGADVSSPMMAQQVEMEGRMRAGELGIAAQRAAMMSDELQRNAAQGYQNYLTNLFQTEMVPMQIQATGKNVPLGPMGPSLLHGAQAGASTPSIYGA